MVMIANCLTTFILYAGEVFARLAALILYFLELRKGRGSYKAKRQAAQLLVI
jgi:hypothetical protein